MNMERVDGGWLGQIADNYTFDSIGRLASGTASWIKEKNDFPIILIGYDTRFLAKEMAEFVALIFCSYEIKVLLTTSYVTHAMTSLATFKRQAHLGIYLSGRDLPYLQAGYYLKDANGGALIPPALDEIFSSIPDQVKNVRTDLTAALENEQILYYDALALYINHLKEVFEYPSIRKSNIKIGVDVLYGSAQRLYRKLFRKLQILHHEIRTDFNNLQPVISEENSISLTQLIQDFSLDIGILIDGAGEGVSLFDQEGKQIEDSWISLMILAYFQESKGRSGKCIFTSQPNEKFAKVLQEKGIDFEVSNIAISELAVRMESEDILFIYAGTGKWILTENIPEIDGVFVSMILIQSLTRVNNSMKQLVETDGSLRVLY